MPVTGPSREQRVRDLLAAWPGDAKLTRQEIAKALDGDGYMKTVYDMWKDGELKRVAEKREYMVGNSAGTHLVYRYYVG